MSDDNFELPAEESARLRELKEALESEFLANETDKANSTPIASLEELKGEFLATIKHVVKHADSYALRAKVSMWGMDKLIDDGKVKKDDLVDLIEGMEKARSRD